MMAGSPIPRLMIAATGSGAGKTTVTIGLIASLRARGLNVAAFKCGPDYLDPTYHARVSGGVSHNLDGWMMGREAVTATFTRAARGADIAVIEGMMGLFDGASPISDEGSSAEIAKWLASPEAKEKLLGQGANAFGGTPEDFARHIQIETAKWAKVDKESGAKVD